MSVIIPPSLKKDDCIGVFAPSSWVEKEDIEKSKSLLEEKGFNVFVHPQTYERENQSAGTHLQKALAFQGLWQRKDVKAIWAAGGGNRCMHLLDIINFEKLKEPKTLIGFSDVTALLNAVSTKTNIVTYHGPVFKNLPKYEQLDHLLGLLEHGHAEYPVKKENILNDGKAKGRLFGGNLSLFQYSSTDTTQNSIIFLEDCNEELSRIDRMLCFLKQSKVFENAAGLIFGQFTNLADSTKPFGYELVDIIKEHTEGLDIPILTNMPFGHGKDLYTFPIGQEAEIDTQNLTFKV